MRKFILVLVSVVFTLPLFAQDEGTITTTIDVSATVTQSIVVRTERNIRLTNLGPNTQETVVSPINDVEAGFIIASGTPNATFRINFLDEQLLTQIEGDGRIRIFYNISGNGFEEQINSEELESNDRNLQFNSEGDYFIWVGGRVILENPSPGAYQGEFIIEIEYI